MTQFVKIVEVPGAVTEIALESGATVADALSAANLAPTSTQTLSVNGSPVETDHVLSDGDRVIISKQAKSA